MLSSQQFPYTGPYSLPTGSHRARGPTALALKRAMKRAGYGFADKELSELDEHYNEALEAALDRWTKGWDGYGEKRWEAIRKLIVPDGRPSAGQYALDGFAQDLVRDECASKPPPPKVPDLGPLWAGGKSVLKQPPTHKTSGLEENGKHVYIAFDDAFTEGTTIIAPEDLTVTASSSSNPGKAFYATGASKIKHWFGHLDRTHSAGEKFQKGAVIGKVCPNSIGGGPHVHHAMDTRPLTGKVLLWGANGNGPDYTWGSPTVGEQFSKALA